MTWLLDKITVQSIDGLGFKKDLLLAEFCQFFGCSHNLAPQFIKELKILGKLIEVEGKLYSTEYFDNFGNKKREQTTLNIKEDEIMAVNESNEQIQEVSK